MSIHHHNDVSQAFDQDHSPADSSSQGHSSFDVHPAHVSFDHHDMLHVDDPLKHVHNYEFKPLELKWEGMHFVHPHDVHSYMKKDGTFVKGYYRDGDGDNTIDRTVSMGGGYAQSNPTY